MALSYVSYGVTYKNGVSIVSPKKQLRHYFIFSFNNTSDVKRLHSIQDEILKSRTSYNFESLVFFLSMMFADERFDELFYMVNAIANHNDVYSYFIKIENIDKEDYSFRQENTIFIIDGQIYYEFDDME